MATSDCGKDTQKILICDTRPVITHAHRSLNAIEAYVYLRTLAIYVQPRLLTFVYRVT